MKDLDYVDANTVILNEFSAGAVIAERIGYGVGKFDISFPPVKAVISHAGALTYDANETNSWIGPESPPAFLVHNSGDKVVPYASTNFMVDRFEALDKSYVLHCKNTNSHLIDPLADYHQEGMKIIQAEYAWLQHILSTSKSNASGNNPTSAPTEAAALDSTLDFVLILTDQPKTQINCLAASNDQNNFCSLDCVSKACCGTCGTCNICEDTSMKFKLKSITGRKVKRKCDWVSLRPATRCSLDGVAQACRLTCGVCSQNDSVFQEIILLNLS